MKKSTRFAALLLSVMMIFGTTTVGHAAGVGKFDDVLTTHWAYQDIEVIAEGGLISGYGNRKFGPDDSFTIAQMAAIISNAIGYEGYTKDGFWAYGYVDYCVNTLKCLPSHGAINAKNYNIPITRELTVYMLINGLGVKNATAFMQPITINDIPDSAQIDDRYVDAVVAAYRNNMTVGIDENKTFNPKGLLTRAQGAIMLVRAGFTKAATADRIDPKIAWENIKKLGIREDKTTKNDTDLNVSVIRFTDPKVGGITVTYNYHVGRFGILMQEENYGAMYNERGEFIDVNGNVIAWPYNEETYEYYASTGYSLEARRFVKKIAACIVGEAGSDVVYEGMKGVFLGTRYDRGGGQACAIMWTGDRPVTISRDSVNPIVDISFSSLDNEMGYKRLLADRVSGMQIKPSYFFSLEHAITAYKLDQW